MCAISVFYTKLLSTYLKNLWINWFVTFLPRGVLTQNFFESWQNCLGKTWEKKEKFWTTKKPPQLWRGFRVLVYLV